MKKILAFAISCLLSSLSFGQVTLIGPESSWNGTSPVLGNYTTNSSGNKWAKNATAPITARVTSVTAGTTLLSSTADINTSSYTGIEIWFREGITTGFPISNVKIQYSINSGSSYTTTSFSSAATTTFPGASTLKLTLPSAAENITTLRIRFTFTANSTSGTYFIDDLEIKGTPTPTSYYNTNVTGGDLSDIASWGTSTDGTGSNPPNFDADGQTFYIMNGTTPTITADWYVNGAGSKIVLGDGTNPVTFTIPDGLTMYAETMDISNAGTLNNESLNSLPTFGSIGMGSTVIFSNNSSGSIPSASYYNLTLSGSGDKNMDGGADYTITNTLNTSSLTGKIVLGSDKLNINGTITGSALISSTSSSQIEVNSASGSVGTLSFDPSNKSINNLNIVSGSVTLGSDITLNGTFPSLSIGASATLDASTYSIGGTGTTELVDLLGTIKTSNLNGFSSGASTTFTSDVSAPTMGSSSTVHYNAASGSQTITPFPEVNAYANLTLSGNATKVFGAFDFYISKDFAVSGGSSTINSSSLFKFTGTSQAIPALNYYKVETSGSGSKTLSSTDSTRISTSLTIGGTSQVVTNGKLVMESTSSSSTGVIIDNTASANGISGSVMVKRYLGSKTDPKNALNPPSWFLSSPVSGVTLNSFQPIKLNIYEYINSKTAGTRWTLISPSASVVSGKGYLVRANATTTHYHYGTVNSGDISIQINATGDLWNLIGNPYPSRLNWDNDASKIDMSNVGGSKQCKIYNGTSYILKDADPGTFIAVGQAMFVEAASTGNIVFKNASRSSTTSSLLRQESTYKNRLELYIKKGGVSDMAVAWAQNTSTNSKKYNNLYDGKKLFPNTGMPAVYFNKENTNLDTYTFGTNEGTVAVPVILNLPIDTTYSFEFVDVEKVDPMYSIYLIDSTSNTSQDLRDNSTYSFTSTAGTKSRFSVLFSMLLTGNMSNDVNERLLSVYSEKGVAYLNSNVIPTKVLIRETSGKVIYDSSAPTSEKIVIDLSTQPSGIYIASVETANKVFNKKFVLNK